MDKTRSTPPEIPAVDDFNRPRASPADHGACYPHRIVRPATDVRDISRIAYGFMASKALFAALNVDLFTRLAGGVKDLATLARETGVAPNRLDTLLAVLTSHGLLVRDAAGWANAPACERYLVRGTPADFGDYYRFQVDRLIYPALQHLDAGLAGDRGGLAPRFDQLDPARAGDFTRAQHAGSLGPALLLAKSVDLRGRRTLLDVGGGSGTFSIVLCRAHPELRATIVDYPNMIEVARRFVAEAGLADRIDFVEGEAGQASWPDGQDVVLMSYLLSAVPASAIDPLLERARTALRPRGVLLVHDFMLDDGRDGPALAAAWFLVYLAWSIDNVSFTIADMYARLARHGFTDVTAQPLVHEVTTVLTARAPA
jgi:2-hydroxy-4-(methylsulfanyl)butanoate S-methyltransferase